MVCVCICMCSRVFVCMWRSTTDAESIPHLSLSLYLIHWEDSSQLNSQLTISVSLASQLAPGIPVSHLKLALKASDSTLLAFMWVMGIASWLPSYSSYRIFSPSITFFFIIYGGNNSHTGFSPWIVCCIFLVCFETWGRKQGGFPCKGTGITRKVETG